MVVPLLSLLTLLIFPLLLYWWTTLQRDWLYSRATSLTAATHIYVRGQGKVSIFG